jgi:short-subunit dehydrogenase
MINWILGATKAFVTAFGASLAGEVHEYGIDVCVVHPR